MSLSDLAALGSFVSSVAVLVSLILLYFQLVQVAAQVKLAEKSARAVIAQERTNRISDIQMQVAQEPFLADAVDKGTMGAPDLTPTQFNQYRAYCSARFLNSEDSFLQHRNGLLSDEAFATFERTFVMGLASPGARVMWKWARTGYDPEFVAFTDRLVAQAAAGRVRGFAEWSADVAAERAAIQPA